MWLIWWLQVFEQSAARLACLRRYSTQSMWSSLAGVVGSKKLRLRDRFNLVVQPAPEPSDVSLLISHSTSRLRLGLRVSILLS